MMWKKYNGRIAAVCVLILMLCMTIFPADSGTEHDFAPVSYDLTNLPPMENEMYAEWEGNIYYRQYSDEDMEDGGL